MSLRFYEDVAFVFFIFLVIASEATLQVDGENVCSITVSFREDYRQSYQVSYRHRSTYKCGFWNFKRCTRYRTIYSTQYRTRRRTAYRKQYQCCKGWSQVGHQCTKAICSPPCVNGTCTKPDNCSCDAGYYGNRCGRVCPSHKWGPHCRHDCLCQNSAKCSPHTGICTCTPGWEGRYCNKTCNQGYYGDKCQNNCTCFHGMTCDPVNGICTCAAGFEGQRCESQCSPSWYGQNCADKCACLNGASCDHVNGTCNCTAGWTGDICNQTCPTGTYGYRCAHKCINCMHGATCDHVTGVCDCKPGYRGRRCEYPCQEGTYGQKCQEICACQNNATCSNINGSCICIPGYTGKHCEYRLENEELVSYDEQMNNYINPLVPSITSCLLVVLLIATVAFGYLLYRKKKTPSRRRTTNPDEHIYALADDQRARSGHEGITETTDVTTEANAGRQETETHVYQTPAARTLAAVNVNDVSYVAMGTQYLDLKNQKSIEANDYQSLSCQTKRQNKSRNVTYDVPAKTRPNVYEEIKLDKESTDQSHYYKGLERPFESHVDGTNTIADQGNAGPSRAGAIENDYKAPREFIDGKSCDAEAFGYATPR